MVRYRSIIIILLVVTLIFANASYCSILDDIMGALGINSSYNETITNDVSDSSSETKTFQHISDENYKMLNNEQKNVYIVTEEIYTAILNIDIDALQVNMNERYNDETLAPIKKFFAENSERTTNFKNIVSNLDYEVISMRDSDGDIVVKTDIKFPDIKKVLGKVLPSIILNNANKIISGNIDNVTAESILKSVNNVISSIGKETYQYDFVFTKSSGKWKLTNINDISINLQDYIRKQVAFGPL